jgi:hypothetical protein
MVGRLQAARSEIAAKHQTQPLALAVSDGVFAGFVDLGLGQGFA